MPTTGPVFHGETGTVNDEATVHTFQAYDDQQLYDGYYDENGNWISTADGYGDNYEYGVAEENFLSDEVRPNEAPVIRGCLVFRDGIFF